VTGAGDQTAAFLASLPTDRRSEIERVRDVIVRNLPPGYVEGIGLGMLTYSVPLSRFPKTYNGQPLLFAALANQKNHLALYLMSVYGDSHTAESFRRRYRATGRKLDMGKSCIRFRHADDLPLDLVGETIASTPVDAYLAWYEAVRAARRSGKAASRKDPCASP